MANLCSAISDIQLAGSQRQGSRPGSPAGLHSETHWQLIKGLDYRINGVPCHGADHQHNAAENEVEGRKQNSHRLRSIATLVTIQQGGSDDPSSLSRGSKGRRPRKI